MKQDMKKIFYLLSIALLSFAAVSCDKKNEPTPPAATTFEVTVTDVTATGATITVVPSDTNTYYFDILTKEEFDTITNLGAYYAEYFEYVVEYYNEYGYDITVADLLSTGEDSYAYTSLSPSTEYVAFAFTTDGTTASNITKVEFTTPEVQQSSMTIAYQLTDTAIWIVPSDSTESYFVNYAETDTIAAYGYTATTYASALYEYLGSYYGSYFSYYCEYEGPVYLPLSSVTENITLFACGSTSGVQTTDWFTYDYVKSTTSAPRRIRRPAIGNTGNISLVPHVRLTRK